MTVGVCYYPEHWDESLWEDDLERMRCAGISVVRVAEFAWSIFERTEGEFSFDFFDRFLALCERKGMKVIFGTPTATPPAWLTHKYPEALNARRDGVLLRHGGRKHYNYNAPIYLEKTAIIVTRLAEHYGHHPVIIGWQIDNELNCETNEFYSEADSVAFRAFLKEKYGTLDKLNACWGTAFWSQTYTDWEEIFVPRPVAHVGINPHLELDYLRFISHSCLAYCELQSSILRAHIDERMFITTNGLFGHMDNHEMTRRSLDVYTYDSYPNFAFGLDRTGKLDRLRDRWSSMKLTEVRSICPHFGVMEQQSGPGSWYSRMESPSPRPGQMFLWAMQSVAHGADFVSFFRWRTCTFGTEIYWHGVLDYDNRDNRRYHELRRFAAAMKKLEPLCGADVVAPFAVVRDYDNVFDAEIDQWHRRVTQQSEDAIFEASQLEHIPMDFVYLHRGITAQELHKYKALIMPHAVIMTKEYADVLKEYVRAGGTLVIGCRSGYKDEYGRCVMTPQPGLLSELTGSDVRDFSFVSPAEKTPAASWNGKKMEMPVFCDVLEAQARSGANVTARYKTGYFDGDGALVENGYGEGRVLHLGSAFGAENTLMIFEHLGLTNPAADVIDAPADVELVLREKDGKRWLFVLNYQDREMEITLKREMLSLLEDKMLCGAVSLRPYEVKVLRI